MIHWIIFSYAWQLKIFPLCDIYKMNGLTALNKFIHPLASLFLGIEEVMYLINIKKGIH